VTDLDRTLDELTPHLRKSTWFETLQLLGGELANRSDEYLDRYISWLLDHAGETIREQAPVVALAANIVHDTHPVARINPETRQRYDQLLLKTFDAFDPSSNVPKRTQLDLLEALGTLGAAVKPQLISATRSRLLDVRRRALEMLIPHLSDDDLFSMTHVLSDRSKEPIKTYINAVVARDRVRAGRLLLQLSPYDEKTVPALAEAANPILPPDGIEMWPQLAGGFAHHHNHHYYYLTSYWHDWRNDRMPDVIAWLATRERYGAGALELLERWEDRRQITEDLLKRLTEAGSEQAIRVLVRRQPQCDDTWDLIRRLAERGSTPAIDIIVSSQGYNDRINPIRRLAENGSAAAIRALAPNCQIATRPWS